MPVAGAFGRQRVAAETGEEGKMGTIDELLNDEPASEEPAVAEVTEQPAVEPEAPVAEASDGPARDEKGRFAPKGETSGASPAPVEDTKAGFDPAPTIAERRRRQAAEERAAALERELEQYRKPQQTPPPSIWDDEQGALNHFGEQILTVAEQRAVARVEERMIARSAEQARAKYDDFDDVVPVFAELVQTNPALDRQLRDSENPGEFAYRTAKTHMELRQHGGSIEALVEARVKAQLEAREAEQPAPPPAPTIPATISNERNVGQRTGPTWSGPRPLSELLS